MSNYYLTDYIDQCILYGYYHKTKMIDIFGDITPEKMHETIRKLHIADEQSGAVLVHLSSGGGCVDSGFGIYDAIRAMKNHVKIVTYSQVASMATIILQAGDERLMTVNSYLMLHEGEAEITGSSASRKQWERLTNLHDERCYKIYHDKVKERKRISKVSLTEKIKAKDWVLTADEAAKWGLCDGIVESY